MNENTRIIKSESDISENEIYNQSPELLALLLKDHSATLAAFSSEQIEAGNQVNIFWISETTVNATSKTIEMSDDNNKVTDFK